MNSAILEQQEGPQKNTINNKTTTIRINMKDLGNDEVQQQDDARTSNPEEIDNSYGYEQTYQLS